MPSNLYRFCGFALLLMCAAGEVQAQCLAPGHDLLIEETFDNGWPADWEAPQQGWTADTGKVGLFSNPGTGGWAHIELAASSATAFQLISPAWELSALGVHSITLSFDLFLKTYQGHGSILVDVWNKGQWTQVLAQSEDFAGRIEIDLNQWSGDDVRMRITYQTNGFWGWGAGIDRLQVTGLLSECGNGLCENGENPDNCPGDCSNPAGPAPGWVQEGTDVYGNPVKYTRYQRGTGCDDCSESVNLGFDFQCLGGGFTSAFLNANGNLTFGGAFSDYTPEPFCLKGPRMVAAFYADVDLTYMGQLSYYTDPDGHYFIAHWKNAPFYGCRRECTQFNSFQVILTDGTISRIGNFLLPPKTTVVFNYGEMQWTTAASCGGVDGFGGQPAVVGINEGNGTSCVSYGSFDTPGYRYFGLNPDPECPANGVFHLSHQTLCFDGETGQVIEERPKIIVQVAPKDRSNLLEWFLAEEKPTYTFTIQRGSDSVHFSPLRSLTFEEAEQIHGNGFQFLDLDLPTGKIYYRIEVADPDGNKVYSPVIPAFGAAEGAADNMHFLSVYPNPFTDQLQVRIMSLVNQPVQYSVRDIQGKPVAQGKWDLLEGRNDHTLLFPAIPAGYYVLAVQSAEGIIHENLIRQ